MFDLMTSIIPRRLFDEPEDNTSAGTSADLRDRGLIRVHGIIPIDLNEKLKSSARRQGINADQLIGQLIIEGSNRIHQDELRHHAAMLRERFGEDWMDKMINACTTATEPCPTLCTKPHPAPARAG